MRNRSVVEHSRSIRFIVPRVSQYILCIVFVCVGIAVHRWQQERHLSPSCCHLTQTLSVCLLNLISFLLLNLEEVCRCCLNIVIIPLPKLIGNTTLETFLVEVNQIVLSLVYFGLTRVVLVRAFVACCPRHWGVSPSSWTVIVQAFAVVESVKVVVPQGHQIQQPSERVSTIKRL